MINEILTEEEVGFCWIDIVAPDEEELLEAALMFQLPPRAVHDCLDLSHLPKYEEHGYTQFILVRNFQNKAQENNLEGLTEKVAIFLNPQYLITIHRQDAGFLSEIANDIRGDLNIDTGDIIKIYPTQELQNIEKSRIIQTELLLNILYKVLTSYREPLNTFEDRFEECEDMVFQKKSEHEIIEDMYILKRQVSVCKRILLQTVDVLKKLKSAHYYAEKNIEDLCSLGERMISRSDAAIDNLHNLMNLNISFQSHYTNDIVRVLTIFSAFFMPLTFIAGIYGMNFEFMPELKLTWGYPAVLLFMLGISIGIYMYFRSKGWIQAHKSTKITKRESTN